MAITHTFSSPRFSSYKPRTKIDTVATRRTMVLLLLLSMMVMTTTMMWSITPTANAFAIVTAPMKSSSTLLFAETAATSSSDKEKQEGGDNEASVTASELLERARKVRAEIAALEGKSLEDVETEAREKREASEQRQIELEEAREARRREEELDESSNNKRRYNRKNDGSYLEVPETADELVYQAKLAVERAFADGLTRQIVRLCLLREGENLLMEDRQWPGGARQMYREAAGPLTRDLVSQVKASATAGAGTGTADDDDVRFSYAPNVTSQDLLDFDGSALITAASQAGPSGDVQAMVQPNTDSRYLRDIQTIDAAMKGRLFLLVNPFWRDVDSWGFDILAPNAKKMAQATIFDDGVGFKETYHVIQKTVYGVNCVAVKAYPYDWQLYAYANKQDLYYYNRAMRLGSTGEEPKSSDFYELLKDRPDEFEIQIL